MLIEGSCHCQAVKFSLESTTPVPYMFCYCSICRKTGGGQGALGNIMGLQSTMKIEGEEHVGVYRAKLADPDNPGQTILGELRRHFCRECGSSLWNFNPAWGDLIYPAASACDTELPTAPERFHIFVDSKASWVEVPASDRDTSFPEFPNESMANWHKRRGLTVD